jgi:type IV secretory pathway TrbL component
MILVLYLMIAFVAMPTFAFIFLHQMEKEFDESNGPIDYFFGGFIGLMAGLLWPIFVVIGGIGFMMWRLNERLQELRREHEEVGR